MNIRFFNVIAGISLSCLCLHANTAEAIFASVKSTGMAATSISYPIDSLAAAYNPAGISVVGDRIDSEVGWVHDTGHANVSGSLLGPLVNGHYEGMKTKDAYPVAFGITKTFNLDCDWAISAGFVTYNRNYQKTTYGRPLFLFGTTKVGLEYLNQTLSPVLAIKWRDRHTIGVSANYQIERLKVNGIQKFDNIFRSINPGSVTNRGYNYSNGWGVTIGYYGQLTDRVSIGATYQPKTSMRRMNKYSGFLAQRGKLDVPEKIGMGIAVRILPCVVVAFDAEYIRWKPVKSLSNKFPALERLGENDGPGFGFVNQWYYRVGLEWAINEALTARIGFRHANTPITRSQTAVNILTLDTVENFLTAGATWAYNACNEFSIVGAYGFEHKVNGRNSIPAALFGGEVDLKEEKFAIGLAWGRKF